MFADKRHDMSSVDLDVIVNLKRCKLLKGCVVLMDRTRGVGSPLTFPTVDADIRPLLATKRVSPCVFDPANGRAL